MKAVLAIGVALAIVACGRPRAVGSGAPNEADADGDDPMRALSAPVATTRYVHAFWLDQARRRTTLWDSAYLLCSGYWQKEDGSKPNCGAVYTANFFNIGARSAPQRPTR